MNLDEFLWHAKRGHGECLLAMKQGNVSYYKDVVKKVFLNNYAFLITDEYRHLMPVNWLVFIITINTF